MTKIYPCLPDETEAELHIHFTDEGVVFDVWQEDEIVRSTMRSKIKYCKRKIIND